MPNRRHFSCGLISSTRTMDIHQPHRCQIDMNSSLTGGNSLRNPSFAQFQKGLPPRCEIAHLAVCVLAVFLLVLYAGFCLWNVQIAVRYSLRSPRALRARRARFASLVGACKCANGEVEGPSPPVIFCGGKRDVSGERFQFLGSEPFF